MPQPQTLLTIEPSPEAPRNSEGSIVELTNGDFCLAVVNNDRVIQLSSGRLIVPAALHAGSGGTYETWSHRGIAMCFLSDDRGKTWRRSTSELHAPATSKSAG